MSPRRMAACVGALALAFSVTGARAAEAERDGLARRLRAIEEAVRNGDASALRAAATRAGRVRVELPDARGSYAPGQLQVVLARMFDEARTRSFAFDDDAARARAATVFARGTWVRRPRDGGADIQASLTFALQVEESDWRIVEIRSSP